MPPLEAFPKSHIVTFKYYVGVISFLEEDYVNVWITTLKIMHQLTLCIGRREPHFCFETL
jgi:hypothetical protein